MTVDAPARSFDRTSPVHAYWLAHCEGFAVRAGRREGVVEEVELDIAQERAAALVVRYGPLRRSRLLPDEVDVVVPDEELLLVPAEESPPRIAPLARQARERASTSARTGVRASGDAASAAARTTRSAAAGAWIATRREATRSADAAWPALSRWGRSVWRRSRRAFATAALETRRATAGVRRKLRRLAARIAPRTDAAGRAAARATQRAADAAWVWTEAGAARVARAAGVHGPRVRGLVEPHLSRGADRLRTHADSLLARTRPTVSRLRSGVHVAADEQRTGDDRDRSGGTGELDGQPADADHVDEREHARAKRQRAGRQA